MKRVMTSQAVVAIAFALSASIAAQTPTRPQPGFATAEEAVRALVDAARASDLSSLIALMGPGSEELAGSTDAVTARKNRDLFVAAMSERWTLEDRDEAHKELIVGNEAWPFPVPLVRRAQGWVFDAAAGKEEILARRIGRNELAAIRIVNTYVKAQKLYASRGHDGRPAGLYARRVASEPGTENGLYWAPSPGQPLSPLSELVAEASVEGRPSSTPAGGSPFHGYHFRILEAQGPAAAGGAKNYIVNGQLSGGFAMIAWPAQPALTGVMTFIVNHDGAVYEKSFGRDTQTAVATITRFNPDSTWTRVEPSVSTTTNRRE